MARADARRRNALAVQVSCDLGHATSVRVLREDPDDDLRSGVDDLDPLSDLATMRIDLWARAKSERAQL
jgi:hypothetical protein